MKFTHQVACSSTRCSGRKHRLENGGGMDDGQLAGHSFLFQHFPVAISNTPCRQEESLKPSEVLKKSQRRLECQSQKWFQIAPAHFTYISTVLQLHLQISSPSCLLVILKLCPGLWSVHILHALQIFNIRRCMNFTRFILGQVFQIHVQNSTNSTSNSLSFCKSSSVLRESVTNLFRLCSSASLRWNLLRFPSTMLMVASGWLHVSQPSIKWP